MQATLQSAQKPYYGWTIAVVLAITETISWGIIHYAFSVFITPMEADLGWTRAELTGAFSLSLLVAGLMAFPVGWWVDQHGARWLMTGGSIAATLLVLAWSQVNSLPALYLIWTGLGICAAMVLYEPAFAVIATWFVRQRSMALAVITFAAGLASTIFLPLSDALVTELGWRPALVALAVLLGVTTIPLHALFLRRRPSDSGYLPDGIPHIPTEPLPAAQGSTLSEALHSRTFWILTLAFSLSYLSAAAIRVHFIPFLIEQGMEASRAAFASGAIGLMQVAGRLIFAPLDRRFSLRALMVGIFTLQAVAIPFLMFNPSSLWLGLFIFLFGTAYGARTLIRPAVLADLFGAAHYGRISSIMALFLTLSATVAPVGAGWLYDQAGSYDLMLWLVMGLGGAAAVVLLLPVSSPKPE